MYYLQQKYEKKVTDTDFDTHALRRQLDFSFWGFFVLYSSWWTFWYFKSEAEEDLKYADFACSFWFVLLIPVYYTICNNLIKSINTLLGYSEDSRSAPGVSQIVTILNLQIVAMSLRAIFVSLQDVQKIYDIDSLSKSSSNWPALMAVQCMTQLFAVFAVYYSMFLINEAEKEISAQPNGAMEPREGKESVLQVSDLDTSDMRVVYL